MASHKLFWDYAHSMAALFAVLLFTASFLCTLLWTNGVVTTAPYIASPSTNEFSQYSPLVSTFKLSYGVAIFGIIWNSVLYAALLILGSDTLPIPTMRLRYDLEKAACSIAVVGNAVYSVACIALLATLAKIAHTPPAPPHGLTKEQILTLKATAHDRAAGVGATAAFAGLAAVTAIFACVMDSLHMQHSAHRDGVKYGVLGAERDATKEQ